MIGATAAITAGVGIYEAWSRNVQRVDDETKQLTDSIVEQGKAVGPTLANALRNILETRKGFDDAFAKSGMTIEGVSQVVNAAVGDMDKAARSCTSSWEAPIRSRWTGSATASTRSPLRCVRSSRTCWT